MEELQDLLAQWYKTHQRELPWRSDPTPYHVWLSEIILQQTRVNQGLEYYLRFVDHWPTLADLAKASEEEVLKMWQGLGYYSRARNLHRCAQQIMERHGGNFPNDYKKLLELQGIGQYTAAAIASIAFGLPYAVVDGNVYRVLARLYDIETPINNEKGAKCFKTLADTLLDTKHPGQHNQALMEFGALHCVPKHPDCTTCPLQAHCLAFVHHTIDQRPVKEKKVKVRTRYFNYLVIKTDDRRVYLKKRTGNDIWKNLYDFPCVESDTPMTPEAVLNSQEAQSLLTGHDFSIAHVSQPYTHKLTHQTIIATFIELKNFKFFLPIQTKNIFLALENELGSFPVPKLIDNYLTIHH